MVTFNRGYLYGWSNLENKYLGFRTITANDSIYGWINIKIDGFTKINIINAAYR
ncbi:MAG: hypothetical protein HN704_13100 [Bacteroidetes bacterium]|nr:hypothetical protein [Bacteroidota bacterium]MBT6687765.1 hypothetical protein [Bacteroidota bacterium]MBT7143399.1 hypothetical protein [Bacteroidota bacterium]MBT7492533.1 hypothetical protein [Bacteroidota bacterium]